MLPCSVLPNALLVEDAIHDPAVIGPIVVDLTHCPRRTLHVKVLHWFCPAAICSSTELAITT
jgi:hypothetical protein